jgi:putative transposase
VNQSQFLHKSHNVSVLLYHFVCPAKYRRAVFRPEVETELKAACVFIEEAYEIRFLEIGADKDHVHFLVQSVPTYSPTEIITRIKSITARWILEQVKGLRKELRGGKLWSSGYFVASVGKHGSEKTIANYVRNQGGGEYRQFVVQESLFGDEGQK